MLGQKTKGQTQHGSVIIVFFFFNLRFKHVFKRQSIDLELNYIKILAPVMPCQVFHFSCSCMDILEDTSNVLFDINISKLFQILLTCQLVKLFVLRTIS